MSAIPEFANADGDVTTLVIDRLSRGYYERRDADGTLRDRTSFEGLRPQRSLQYMTVDGGRLLLRRLGPDPKQFSALPATLEPGPQEQAVQAWLARAGGLLGDGNYGESQRTNDRVNLSCAIGADYSVAIWDFADPASFRATDAHIFPAQLSNPFGLYCLKPASGSMVVAVNVVDVSRPVGSRSRLFIIDVSRDTMTEPANFNSAHRIEAGRFMAASTGLIALVPIEGNQPLAFSRVLLRGGLWVAEEAPIETDLEIGPPLAWRTPYEGLIGIPQANELRRITWPEGGAPAIGDVIAHADTPVKQGALRHGAVNLSARGDWLLWDNARDDQFEVEWIGSR